jgi:hypothetical protein
MKTFQYKIFIAVAPLSAIALIIAIWALWPGETEPPAKSHPPVQLDTAQDSLPPELKEYLSHMQASGQGGPIARQDAFEYRSAEEMLSTGHPDIAPAKKLAFLTPI